MDPATLRRDGERLLGEALRAADAGDQALARSLMMRAQVRLEAAAMLTNGEQSLTLPDMDHALSVSVGRSDDNAFQRALHAKGLTLRSLAPQVGVSGPLLTMSLRGVRTIRRAVADRIAEIVGAPWPGKISEK